jgi:hypothetical protein
VKGKAVVSLTVIAAIIVVAMFAGCIEETPVKVPETTSILTPTPLQQVDELVKIQEESTDLDYGVYTLHYILYQNQSGYYVFAEITDLSGRKVSWFGNEKDMMQVNVTDNVTEHLWIFNRATEYNIGFRIPIE